MGADLIGALLDGRYKIVERVAEGAMGVVYRGERIKLGRAVAIKFLHTWNAADAAARKRFEVEARAMARLEHPNCAAVIDVGEYDGAPYVVMDYVRGTTLRTVLDDGALEPTRAAEIARQVLSGLAHAHDLDIVHRDIKPANIMLSEKTGIGEMVKILDFGLARFRGSPGSLTAGIAIGTPSYMAPEQITGDAVDARTDIYACGVLLFEMLTGDKPFTADEPLEVLRMHRESPPPRVSEVVPEARRDDVRAFDAVVLRALQKRPEDRFASAAELAVAIDEALRARAGGVPAATLAVAAAAAAPPPGAVTTRIDAAEGAVATAGASNQVDAASGAGAPRVDDAAAGSERGARSASLGEGVSARQMSVTSAEASTSSAPPGAPDPRARRMDPRHRRVVLAGAAAIGGLAVIGIIAAVASGGDSHHAAVDAAVPVVVAPLDAPDPSDDVLGRAHAMVDRGDADGAIRLLDAARRTYPDRAVISFELGKLYFGRLWWRDGLDAFRAAIKADPGFRTDPELIKTVLRGFITTPETDEGLARFLRSDIGDAAIPYLQETADSHPSEKVRARATALLARFH